VSKLSAVLVVPLSGRGDNGLGSDQPVVCSGGKESASRIEMWMGIAMNVTDGMGPSQAVRVE
jgi:hypothetical protein